MTPYYEDLRCQLYLGDCAEVLPQLAPNSIHALVTDPPAGIGFMGQHWDKDKGGRDAWIAWLQGIMEACVVALRPGAHGLVWAIPRTSHWAALAIEDAGLEIRDIIMHLFGSGFPKSLDVGKAIDRAAGAERAVVGKYGRSFRSHSNNVNSGWERPSHDRAGDITVPATEEARQWDGWGTALKPGGEHWILARKPFRGTVAANLLEHETGALNINACRLPEAGAKWEEPRGGIWGTTPEKESQLIPNPLGRYPANVIHDGSPEVLDAFAEYGERPGQLAPVTGREPAVRFENTYSHAPANRPAHSPRGDKGTAARFFYCAKATKADREEGLEELVEQVLHRVNAGGLENDPRWAPIRRRNHHPTVKNVELMKWLCKLITPPGGVILDPFMGSGSTGKAAMLEGFRFIGIEREPEFLEIAKRRILHAQAVADEAAEAARAKAAQVSFLEPEPLPAQRNCFTEED